MWHQLDKDVGEPMGWYWVEIPSFLVKFRWGTRQVINKKKARHGYISTYLLAPWVIGCKGVERATERGIVRRDATQ